MSGSFLLDTNIIIAFFQGEKRVHEQLVDAKIYLPAIVVGELMYGAEKSEKKDSNKSSIQRLIEQVVVLPITADTSKHYGAIKNYLKEKGKPIPENDIWIAALAAEYEIVLVTRDKHFEHIPQVQIQTW